MLNISAKRKVKNSMQLLVLQILRVLVKSEVSQRPLLSLNLGLSFNMDFRQLGSQ